MKTCDELNLSWSPTTVLAIPGQGVFKQRAPDWSLPVNSFALSSNKTGFMPNMGLMGFAGTIGAPFDEHNNQVLKSSFK